MNNVPVKSWRYRGQSFDHVDVITEQHAVPTLPEILENVLSGYGTGLNSRDSVEEYDETNVNLNLMDPLDREALRQSTEEVLDGASRPSSSKPKASQSAESGIIDNYQSSPGAAPQFTPGATPQPPAVAGNPARTEPAGAAEKGV